MKTIKDLRKAIDGLPDDMPLLIGNFFDDCKVIKEKTVQINFKHIHGLHISDEEDE